MPLLTPGELFFHSIAGIAAREGHVDTGDNLAPIIQGVKSHTTIQSGIRKQYMRKMRVLWLSNKVQTNEASTGSGTWLESMAKGLVQAGEVELGNIAHGPVRKLTRKDSGEISQWVVPLAKLGKDGLPGKTILAAIIKGAEEFEPDLVHIWGTENFWGLLTARGYLRKPASLEMQGFKMVYARTYSGGLSLREQLSCIGPKEILRGATIFQERRRFKIWGNFEKEIIRKAPNVTVQSSWMRAWVQGLNPACRIFESSLPLRDSFCNSPPWEPQKNPVLFTSAAYPAPYKGLHVAVRAVALLRHGFPGIRLRIAGAHQRPGIRQSGYISWLNREARRLSVESNLTWLGPLNGDELVREMHSSAAFVLPTFIENCCTSMQEAMMVGIPVVASYCGGLPSIGKDEESALFFPPGDEAMCAYQIRRLLTDHTLAELISQRARKTAIARNNTSLIVQRQIDIYRQILTDGASLHHTSHSGIH